MYGNGGLNEGLSWSAVGHICAVRQAYLSGEYANNVKGMYTSAFGHNFDYSELIWGIYTDMVASYLHISNLYIWHMCGIWRAYLLLAYIGQEHGK